MPIPMKQLLAIDRSGYHKKFIKLRDWLFKKIDKEIVRLYKKCIYQVRVHKTDNEIFVNFESYLGGYKEYLCDLIHAVEAAYRAYGYGVRVERHSEVIINFSPPDEGEK